jgi:hypothetical protein
MVEKVKWSACTVLVSFATPVAARADVAQLRPAVFRVKIGLELQRVPVVFTAFEARDARLDPLFHRQMVRFDACCVGYG